MSVNTNPYRSRKIKRNAVVLTLSLILISLISFASLKSFSKEYRLKQKISTLFRDPESVNFKNTFFSDNGSWCGMVNAKNSYGDYTGFRLFGTTKSGVFMSDEMTKPTCIGSPDGSQLESPQCDDERLKVAEKTTGTRDQFLNFYSRNCKTS